MTRKKAHRRSGRGLWLGILVAVLLVGGLLFLLGRRPISPTVHPTKPTQQTRTLALGSYGATVHTGGQARALEIRPLARLTGPAGSRAPVLPRDSVEAIVTNTLLSYPELDQLSESTAARRAFRKLLEARLTQALPPPAGRWKLQIVQLRTRLRPIPPS